MIPLVSLFSSESLGIAGGIAGLVTVAITSLRKRQDLSFDELKNKAARVTVERDDAIRERDEARADRDRIQDLREDETTNLVEANVTERRKVALLRGVLADHQITDPTAEGR